MTVNSNIKKTNTTASSNRILAFLNLRRLKILDISLKEKIADTANPRAETIIPIANRIS
ncbi:MAG: hypothetical protein M1331_02770 [Candidatus Marsarchaeota archaeon]|nr:hypothetical protein [Candidatus Marsarchaeota archaeon]